MFEYTKIRELREDNDRSQQDIAKVLNITQPQYHLYESGKREIPFHMVIKLADYYGVSLDWIAGRSDRKHT